MCVVHANFLTRPPAPFSFPCSLHDPLNQKGTFCPRVRMPVWTLHMPLVPGAPYSGVGDRGLEIARNKRGQGACTCLMHVMHACLHACVSACTRVCMHTCLYVYARVSVCANAYAHTHFAMSVCMQACIHACMHTCMHAQTNPKHMHAYNDACMCTHVLQVVCPFFPSHCTSAAFSDVSLASILPIAVFNRSVLYVYSLYYTYMHTYILAYIHTCIHVHI